MSPDLDREAPDDHRFSITTSPFVRMLHRLHLTRADDTPRAWALCAIAWVPLFIGALIRLASGQRPPPILLDLSVHVRLLVVIPLLIQAERLLVLRCRDAMNQLYAGDFAPRDVLDRVLAREERLRDARRVELALFAIAFGVGQASLWGLALPTGLFAGITEAGAISFARLWYVIIALPIVQFLIIRWLWHWALWSYVLFRLSRLRLATLATHPDHAAGLGSLGSPLSAFAGFVFAIAVMTSAVWGTQILNGRATMQSFVPTFVLFVVVVSILALGPQLLFVGALYRARHREVLQYSKLALMYARAFHRKWVEEGPGDRSIVDAPDFSSFIDLIGVYENLVRVRLVPFSSRSVLGVWVAAVAPMLPLVATTVPIDKLLLQIGRALLGGIPV